MSHLTMLNGTQYAVKGGKTLIGGTAYSVSKGRTMVNGTAYDILFTQVIEAVPTQSGSLTYTGSTLSPSWANYDSSVMTIGGTTSAVNAGTYTATFTPVDGYVWADGSSGAKSVTWSIGKAAGKVTLSKTSVTFSEKNARTTFTVTRVGDGDISVASSNTSVATVTLSGSTVTVTSVASGSANITVTVSEGTNHFAASSTCSVKVSIPTYTVSFSGANNSYVGASYRIGDDWWNTTNFENGKTYTLEKGTTISCWAGGYVIYGYIYLNGTVVAMPTYDSSGVTEPAYYSFSLNSNVSIRSESASEILRITTS